MTYITENRNSINFSFTFIPGTLGIFDIDNY